MLVAEVVVLFNMVKLVMVDEPVSRMPSVAVSGVK